MEPSRSPATAAAASTDAEVLQAELTAARATTARQTATIDALRTELAAVRGACHDARESNAELARDKAEAENLLLRSAAAQAAAIRELRAELTRVGTQAQQERERLLQIQGDSADSRGSAGGAAVEERVAALEARNRQLATKLAAERRLGVSNMKSMSDLNELGTRALQRCRDEHDALKTRYARLEAAYNATLLRQQR